MAPFLLVLGVAGAAGIAYLIFGKKEEQVGPGIAPPAVRDDILRRAAALPNKRDVGVGTYRLTMPDGAQLATNPDVAAVMLATVQTGDTSLMTEVSSILKNKGWSQEGVYLDYMQVMAANPTQVPGGKAGSGTVTPGTASQSLPPELPASLLAQMQTVVTRQNPAEMRALAQQLRAAGYTEAAQSLEAAAALVEAAQTTVPTSGTVTPSSPPNIVVTPAAPTPVLQLPPMVITPQGETTTPRRAAADLLVRHLTVDNPPKGKEDQGLVRNYQALAGRSVDGKYGPGDAMSLYDAASGKHVPPPPRYWPKNGYQAAKAKYDQWLASMQTSDPARTGEWQEARANSRKYYPS